MRQTARSPRVAVLADVGQAAYHVGDEAIAHGAVHQLRRRGITDLLLLTRNREDTRARFGKGIATASTLQFPWPPVDRERYLAEIVAVMDGQRDALPPHDQVFSLIEALDAVDALLIAGGGNMNSTYGWLLYERAAVAHIAHRLGKPVVISGQTLGPVLSPPDTDVLRDLLSTARLAGLREDASHALAAKICPSHPHLHRCLDDATELPGASPRRTPEPGRFRRRIIAATFSPATGDVPPEEAARAYARLLDRLAMDTSARVLLLPHMAVPGEGDGDERFHAMVASRMVAPVTQRSIAGALRTARLTTRADLVVTSRYHPVIFGLGGAVPVLAVSPDEYTEVRIGGALRNWGLPGETAALGSLVNGGRDVDADVDRLVASRAGVAATLRATRPAVTRAHSAWWDQVAAALG